MQIKVSDIRKIIITLILTLGISVRAYAVDMSALDFNGDLLGKVIPDGSVINFDNELIGHITADGLVVDTENEFIGGVVPTGIVIGVDNNILGKVNNDGSVTANDDSLIGKVLPSGLAVNNNYNVIGLVISAGLVYDDNGKIIGRISGDGKFYNLGGENNGFVTSSGYVYIISEEDKKISLGGKLINSKMVISSTGKFLGSIAPDGKVIDLKKNVIGSIHANGFAYNSENVAIGHIVENGYAFNTDGTYLGVVSYNGEVVNKGNVVAFATFNHRVIDKEGNLIGFTINMSATANTMDGKYLGYISNNGSVVKGRRVVGKIGATGNIIDSKGKVIGFINQTGPVFNYIGQIYANAGINGQVVSLDGKVLGYMHQERAFDNKQKEVGKVVTNRLNFNKNNEMIGISGINSEISYKNKKYITSPYGYLFDEQGNIEGRNYKFSEVYSMDGNFLTGISSTGQVENASLKNSGNLTSAGYFIDKNNKLIGGTVSQLYATNFVGQSQGFIGKGNLIANDKNELYAKILPNGNVIAQNAKNLQNLGQAHEASISIGINGDYLGTNMANGEVVNSGEIIGKVSSNKYIIDNSGAVYGKILDFGTAVSSDCKFLGIVSDNGDIRNAKGIYVGMALANGQVVNDTEEVLGYIISPETVIGKNGENIGVQNPLGSVLNYKNQNVGCEDILGNIRNSQKEIVGQKVLYTSVMDFENKIQGFTNLNGKVINFAGTEIGYMSGDGSVKNAAGEDIGILFKYTVAFDNNNTYLGRVNLDGNVVSDNGENIGRVNYDGSVITKDGKEGFALYDLYVYDNDNKTVGYIAKNGRIYSIMGTMKGTIYKGFVIDKKQNLIARGSRDYNIRNADNNIIGYLNLDGTVINYRNIEIGSLSDNGEIVDGSGTQIATALPLQYYQKEEYLKSIENEDNADNKGEIGSEKGSKKQNDEEASSDSDVTLSEKTGTTEKTKKDQTTDNSDEEYDQEDNDILLNYKNTQNTIGMAISPGGKYIGTVNAKREVLDEKGNVIGFVGEDGQITDINGKVIGMFQNQQVEKPKGANSKWWQNVINGVTVSPYDNTNTVSQVGPGGGVGPGERYNPRRAAIIANLQQERRRSIVSSKIERAGDIESYTGWQDDWSSIYPNKSISTLRVDMSYMITGDKPIPAVLARSIISLGEAPVTAIVERNVYGDEGRNVIIPAGSRIIGGMQESNEGTRIDNVSGGMKMDITWERIIRPDGIAFNITTAKTGDAEGRGGGALGYVDEQLVKKYGLRLAGTLATSAIAYMIAANDDAAAGSEIETSKQQSAQDAREKFLDNMDGIMQEIVQNKEQIQTVTYVPAGTRVIIYPGVDLWLRTTKDIDKNNSSQGEGAVQDVLVTSDGNDDKSGGGEPQGQGQPQNNNAPNPQGDQGQVPNNGNVALPPPAADGTGANYDNIGGENEEGEIDLDF